MYQVRDKCQPTRPYLLLLQFWAQEEDMAHTKVVPLGNTFLFLQLGNLWAFFRQVTKISDMSLCVGSLNNTLAPGISNYVICSKFGQIQTWFNHLIHGYWQFLGQFQSWNQSIWGDVLSTSFWLMKTASSIWVLTISVLGLAHLSFIPSLWVSSITLATSLHQDGNLW